MLYRLSDTQMIETKYVNSVEATNDYVWVNLIGDQTIGVKMGNIKDAKARMEVIAAAVDRLNGLEGKH